MNHLAHFHLARSRDDWLVGALLGDYIKGPLRGELPHWEQGIRLHRKIDALSDNHALRTQLAGRLPPLLRRYAGIILDVCCDHWLTRHWQVVASLPLPVFADRVYGVLDQHAAQLDASSQHLITRLRDYNLLCGYEDWEAVPATLRWIGMRLPRANPLITIDSAALTAARDLEGEFPNFYAELTAALAQAGFAVSE